MINHELFAEHDRSRAILTARFEAGRTLESIGATVDTASSGARALEMIGERDDYRVIILDWKMSSRDRHWCRYMTHGSLVN